MRSIRQNLLSTAAILPAAAWLAAGAVLVGAMVIPEGEARATAVAPANPPAVKKPQTANPEAAVRVAAACNPCAAKKACNPCNPCNPCAANAGLVPTDCFVPSLKTAAACNPCAAKKVCAACNPCAAKKVCAACNPCAAKKVCAACNPCAAKKACAACNPCAAKKACAACNPCAAKKACAACNPCAAKKVCAACNPCAAKKACSPCNPCAAKKAANPCNPCNPCAASAVEVSVPADEMVALYGCLQPKMKAAYAKGDHWAAKKWGDWDVVSTMGYRSETHGGRFVQNAANKIAAATYGKFEEVKAMPIGSTIAKPSFVVSPDGQASIGPLFLMEKMTKGWNADTADWRYAMIMPDGSTFGITKGHNAAGMGFCVECHAGAKDNDYLLFIPEEFRRK
jgi:hypothetical protein